MIKVRVAYIEHGQKLAKVCELTRVPCVGEVLYDNDEEQCYYVQTVIHHMTQDPTGKGELAEVRVK